MREVLELINQMSPYVLLGFLLAGLMHTFVPNTMYRRFLGGSSFRSVLNAAILGIPLPLCSCGVIPTAMSLRKEGASKGATVAFLIATPQTGVDSIIATYSLMGLPFALLRPLAALATSLLGGFLVNKFADDNAATVVENSPKNTDEKEKKTFLQKMAAVLRYAFVDMMQDIGKWLVVGLVVAGLITVFVPDEFFAFFSGNSLLSMLFVLALSIPMYLCATGSIPIAVALMMKGLSPGTALVLLMAGPAVNAASMLIVSKVMGRRTLLIYLGSIVLGAVLFGLGIDYVLPREWFVQPLEFIHLHDHHGFSYFTTGCSVLLAVLLVNAFVQRHRHGHGHCHCHDHAHGCDCGHCGGECDCESVVERVFRVEGMSCNHCKSNVEKAALGVDGVSRASAELAAGTLVVGGDFDDDAVIKAVEGIGFTVRLDK